ncbi:MAG: hypothetical protein MI785_05175 [Kiloniellales bacterium]|nr:hypothetical protein [Kiloniellales bacterium]
MNSETVTADDSDVEPQVKAPFANRDEFLQALNMERDFLSVCLRAAADAKASAGAEPIREWFDTWEDRLQELRDLVADWQQKLAAGRDAAVLEEARLERDMLDGLIGLSKTTRLGYKNAPDDSQGEIAKEILDAYVKDAQRTKTSMKKVIDVLKT